MKKSQINAMLKKGKLSPFMVAKLMFNDIWRDDHMQEPVFSDNEKQTLMDNMPYDEYYQFRKWKDWFIEIDDICSKAKEFYLLVERNLFQLLWLIDKDVKAREYRAYLKNLYPLPVTEKQYQDLKKKDREDKLNEKYSITSCLIQMIEDKLPGPEKGLTLEDYIHEENENKIKDRKLIAGHYKNAVTVLLSLINKGKITPTRKAQLLPSLKASFKKTPDQIADILLSGIYADVAPPVKIFEVSTVIGKQLYKHCKEWVKYVDTFYPETGGGYAIIQETNPYFIGKNGYYEPASMVNELLNPDNDCLSKINGGAYTFLSSKFRVIADNLYLFQFVRMVLDVLSDELSIELNQGLKSQVEYLEVCRTLLFSNLTGIAYSDKKLSDLINQYEGVTLEQYYPSPKVVEFCKSTIHNMSEYKSEWFYDIKDFYMKEDRIKSMTPEEIEHMKSMGNKEQVKHFMGLIEQANFNE